MVLASCWCGGDCGLVILTEIVFYLTLLIDASFQSADSLPVLDVEETAGKFNTLGTYSI